VEDDTREEPLVHVGSQEKTKQSHFTEAVNAAKLQIDCVVVIAGVVVVVEVIVVVGVVVVVEVIEVGGIR
jgi:hypothetical protein